MHYTIPGLITVSPPFQYLPRHLFRKLPATAKTPPHEDIIIPVAEDGDFFPFCSDDAHQAFHCFSFIYLPISKLKHLRFEGGVYNLVRILSDMILQPPVTLRGRLQTIDLQNLPVTDFRNIRVKYIL